jgi:hypothetical protein
VWAARARVWTERAWATPPTLHSTAEATPRRWLGALPPPSPPQAAQPVARAPSVAAAAVARAPSVAAAAPLAVAPLAVAPLAVAPLAAAVAAVVAAAVAAAVVTAAAMTAAAAVTAAGHSGRDRCQNAERRSQTAGAAVGACYCCLAFLQPFPRRNRERADLARVCGRAGRLQRRRRASREETYPSRGSAPPSAPAQSAPPARQSCRMTSR